MILVTGSPTAESIERLRAEGHTVVQPERTPITRHEIGTLLMWTCENANAVYLGPCWRQDTTARALRAAAVATRLQVLGFA